ncbi:MAG: hypothetical protein R3Y26_04240 [Rikenellaceae bacterium]
MKKILGLFIVITSIFSCQENPLEYIESGEWNKEKNLISITFAGQVGESELAVSAESNTLGYGNVVIMTPDYSQPIEIKTMEISYGSVASVNIGDKISFDPTTKTTEITVTAADGKNRTYTLTASALDEDLVGTWQIRGMNVWGGAATKWGCSAMMDVVNPNDGSMWDTTTGAAADLDNTLTFTLEGLNDDGNTYGTCVNDAGADGLDADFIWLSPAGGLDITDCNSNFRRIPTGKSKWTRNSAAGTVTFEKDGVSYTCEFLYSGNYDCVGEEETRSLTIDNNAFSFKDQTFLTDWNDNVLWSTYGRMVCWPLQFFVQVEKL